MPRKTHILTLCLFTILAVFAAVNFYKPPPVPAATHVFPAGANIYFATDRTHILFKDDCVELTWHIYQTQEIVINQYPRGLDGQETWCGIDPQLSVILNNGEKYEQTYPRYAKIEWVSRQTVNGILLVFIIGLGLPWIYSIRRLWLPLVEGIRRSLAHFIIRVTGIIWTDGGVVVLLMTGMLMTGASLRIMHLHELIRYDEAFTYVVYASQPFKDVVQHYNEPNNHLFYTIQVHFLTKYFGLEPWLLRMPALVYGLALIPAAYFAGRALFSKNAGLISAAVMTFHPAIVSYSVNARGYSLLILLATLLIPLSVWLLRSPHRKSLWLTFIACGVVGFYTIPIMLYPFGTICMWLGLGFLWGLAQKRRMGLIRLVLAGVSTVIAVIGLYMPVFLYEGVDAVTSNPFVTSPGWSSFLQGLVDLADYGWRQWNRDFLPLITWLFVAGFGVGLVRHHRIAKVRVPLVIAAALWIIPVLLVQQVYGVGTRVWLFLIPFYIVSASGGVAFLLEKLPRPNVVVPLLIALFVVANSAYVLERDAITGYEDNVQLVPRAYDIVTTIHALEGSSNEASIVFRDEWSPEVAFYAIYYGHPNANIVWPLFPKVYIIQTKADSFTRSLAYHRVDVANYTEPELVESFGGLHLYVVYHK